MAGPSGWISSNGVGGIIIVIIGVGGGWDANLRYVLIVVKETYDVK